MSLANNKFRLIAFDIDGTILNGDLKVCERLKDVVKDLQHKNYMFTLVTARPPLAALDFAQELNIQDDIIVLNGSLITNQYRSVSYNCKFEVNLLKNLLNELNPYSSKISINYYHDFEWIIGEKMHEIDPSLRELIDLENYKPIYDSTPPSQVNKVSIMGGTELLKHVKHLNIAHHAQENLSVVFSHPNYLEVTCNTISKLNGLNEFALKRNIELSQIMAFGDGENDIPMLKGVGHGVAMGNALSHVKSAAHAVTLTHYEDGVAIYLENLINKGLL